MPDKHTTPQSNLNASMLLCGLACPACKGDLRLEEGRLVCARCDRRYPIIDSIPVLITERAVMPFDPGSDEGPLGQR